MMTTNELDGLEKRIAWEHQLDCEAIARVKRLLERAPGGIGVLLNGGGAAPLPGAAILPAVVAKRVWSKPRLVTSSPTGKTGKKSIVGKSDRAFDGEKTHRPGSSKSALVAREFIAGLRTGTEFTLGEVVAKVRAGGATESELVLKARLSTWMRDQGGRMGVERLGRGRFKKGGSEHRALSKEGNEETYRERVERLKVLREEVNRGVNGAGADADVEA